MEGQWYCLHEMSEMTTARTRSGVRSRWAWVLLAASAVVLFASTRIRINPTATSAPRGLYLLSRSEPRRGSRVRVCLPETHARFGRGRGYLDAGTCPGGVRAVGKVVAALPGDRVELAGDTLRVNGTPLPGVGRLARDSAGRFIPAVPEGTYRVAPGTAWLVSEFNPRSWDSRYYGAVPLAEETPVLRPLWLFGPPSEPEGAPGR